MPDELHFLRIQFHLHLLKLTFQILLAFKVILTKSYHIIRVAVVDVSHLRQLLIDMVENDISQP